MAGFVWPLVLEHGDITLRPMRWGDKNEWQGVRERSKAWLAPWESTHPDGLVRSVRFMDMLLAARKQARAGHMLPMVIEWRGQLVGQITLGNIVWGSLRQGYIGYWIGAEYAGRGITTTAVAMLTDHALLDMGLHRVEINIRPENVASIRVVEKNGFHFEGLRPRYLHIDGDWRDHHCYVMTSESLPSGGITRLRPADH